MDQNTYDLCLNYDPIEYDETGGNGNFVNNTSQAFLLLSLHALTHPEDEKAASRVREQLENLVSGGKEPSFSAGPYWNLAFLSCAIAVAKATPRVWEQLSRETVEKLDLVMACFAISTSFSTDDDNFYKTGPALTGNFYKTWNPNHRMANIEPILFSTLYFGSADKVNEILVGFDHDEYMKTFDRFGFTNVRAAWDRQPFVLPDGTLSLSSRELMMKGGKANLIEDVQVISAHRGDSLGDGIGVKHPYRYLGHPLSDLSGIAEELLRNNFSGGSVFSEYVQNGERICYIIGDLTSPVEGKDGMMKEFNSGDGRGIRSSASYCYEDFALVVFLLRAMELLGSPMPKSGELFELVKVGNTDFTFKLENGYHGFSLGKGYDTTVSKYPFYPGIKAVWNDYLAE